MATVETQTSAPPLPDDAGWPLRYASVLVVVDSIAIFLGLVCAYLGRFGLNSRSTVAGYSYFFLLVLLGPVWLATMLGHRCYEPRLIGAGSAEYRRVFVAGLRLFGYLAIVCYVGKIALARGFVAIAFPVGLGLLLSGRYGARLWLRRHRDRTGAWVHRVLAVGDREHVQDLVATLARERHGGFTVIGACVPGADVGEEVAPGVMTLCGITGVMAAAREAHVDTVAVTASPGVTPRTLRQLSWDLEGTGIGMVVAPALTDVAGPRISVRPVAGLPLLHVDEPELGAVRRLIKRAMDLGITSVALVLLSPVFLGVALAVRLSSPGPVLFRQTRVGAGGKEFQIYKFRSMYADAEVRLRDVVDLNEAGGLLFKVRDDPRVTRVGRWLRRLSLDEVPQLVNVLRGDMSLVGPRPPLPSEVSQYDHVVLRRLRVEPGITGLWQVSGRSDLSWEDSVRLDLYYVENWSPALDLTILARTVLAVLRGSGAY